MISEMIQTLSEPASDSLVDLTGMSDGAGGDVSVSIDQENIFSFVRVTKLTYKYMTYGMIHYYLSGLDQDGKP